MFARAAGDGAHPRLAEVLAEVTVTWVGTVDDEFGRVLGLVLDGLLPWPPPDAPTAGAGVPHRPPGPLNCSGPPGPPPGPGRAGRPTGRRCGRAGPRRRSW